METSKDKLLQTVQEHLNETECAFLYELINLIKSQGFLSKKDLASFAYTKKETDKMDSALPCEYVKRIQEILPNFNTFYHMFDYNTQRAFGEMNHVGEKFIEKLIQTFKTF